MEELFAPLLGGSFWGSDDEQSQAALVGGGGHGSAARPRTTWLVHRPRDGLNDFADPSRSGALLLSHRPTGMLPRRAFQPGRLDEIVIDPISRAVH